MRFVRRILPYALLALIVLSVALLVVRRDDALDWVATRTYQPESHIVAMADQTTMTPYAKRLFYVNRPAVEDRDTFNNSCTDLSEEVAVLGCFAGNRQGIHIYDVTDERLNGIKEVTAAHEMLHQAYQRLGKKERQRIDALLQGYYDKNADERIKNKLGSYKKMIAPDHLYNEMHSIFGTEAVDLPSELEEYYKRYFTDRRKVLALHMRYQSEFDKRITQINDYDRQLEQLKAQIEADKLDLDAQVVELRERREQLDEYLGSGMTSEYNAAVPGFNAAVASYRALVNRTNDKVNQFNNLLAERNELAVQERELEAAIDSKVDPASRR